MSESKVFRTDEKGQDIIDAGEMKLVTLNERNALQSEIAQLRKENEELRDGKPFERCPKCGESEFTLTEQAREEGARRALAILEEKWQGKPKINVRHYIQLFRERQR